MVYYILEERDFGIVAHAVTDIDEMTFFSASPSFFRYFVLPIARELGEFSVRLSIRIRKVPIHHSNIGTSELGRVK